MTEATDKPSLGERRRRIRWLMWAILLMGVGALPMSWAAHTLLLTIDADEPYTEADMKHFRRVNKRALTALEKLRVESGRRWTVLSAYRTQGENTTQHGRTGSQHLTGKAFDLRVPHWARSDFYEDAKKAGFTAFGWGNGSVHVDIRSRQDRWWTYDNGSPPKPAEAREKWKFLYKAPANFREAVLENTDASFKNNVRGLSKNGLRAIWVQAKHHWRKLKWDLMALYRDVLGET